LIIILRKGEREKAKGRRLDIVVVVHYSGSLMLAPFYSALGDNE